MIEYKTIDNFRPGVIEKLIKQCYKELIKCFPDEKHRWYIQWEKEDNEAFINRETIGKCVLFSCINSNPIGYFSWDERQYPLGILGQNCIRPDYQGNGYGKGQIERIIKIFQDKKFNKIQAITGDHKFFIPAQKMYINCGFQEQKRIKGDFFERIEFSKLI